MFVPGCPRNITLLTEYGMAVDGTDYIDSTDIQGSKDVNFTLRSWAKFLLQRHGLIYI
jgi:hypothetical protein